MGAERTFTRWDGTVVPASQANFGDYLFHGQPQLNPALRTLISGTPYAGLVYGGGRLLNAAMTYLGQHGYLGNGQPNPSVTPAVGGVPQMPVGPGDSSTDPGNPDFKLPGTGDPSSPGHAPQGPTPGGIGIDQQSGRFTNVPSFFPSIHQAMFPGSAVGPWGGGASSPYVGQFFHPSMGGSREVSPAAAAYESFIKSRYQL